MGLGVADPRGSVSDVVVVWGEESVIGDSGFDEFGGFVYWVFCFRVSVVGFAYETMGLYWVGAVNFVWDLYGFVRGNGYPDGDVQLGGNSGFFEKVFLADDVGYYGSFH